MPNPTFEELIEAMKLGASILERAPVLEVMAMRLRVMTPEDVRRAS